MKRLAIFFIALSGVFAFSVRAQGQLIERAGNLIRSALHEAASDSIASGVDGSVTVDDRLRRDSLRIRELELMVQEMKLKEVVRSTGDSRAVNHDEQRRRVDSLRAVTPGVPVVVDGDTLMTLYTTWGGYSPDHRAEMIGKMIVEISKDKTSSADSLLMVDYDSYADIVCGDRVVMSVSDRDAMWQGVSRQELAESYIPVLTAKIDDMRHGHTLLGILLRVVLFVIVVAVQWFLFRFTNYLFRKLRRHIVKFKHQRLNPIIIRDYELLNKRQLGRILIFLSNVVRYIVLLVQLMFSVPMMFAIFPQTEKLALKIFLYIIEPVKMVGRSIVDYIPNLFIILVIWFCIKYLIRGLHYIAGEIEHEKLKINGFYPDWAQPSFNIIRFLLYAFMIAMIYPYLPGANSGVFQGISVFVGLIVSLGSSTVIGNIIAGLVITYMRPFKLGDRIKLNDTMGNVIEKTPFVTRLRTPKNEVVTIPNSFIMSSHTVNYSASARQFGLIIHTTVTIGYDAPWRLVHQLLINAARITPGVEEHPKPFVLETDLQDYYPCYQINAYIKDADRQAQIMTDLHQNIQDIFNEAGVEIMSPRFVATRDGNASTIPSDPMKDKFDL